MRPNAPRTSRGMSSFHAGASFSATSSLFALESAEIMSHHSASVFSVEKPIVVPWKLSRARRICSAALIRSSWRGSLGWRLRIRYQSMTADVGHRLGSSAMLSSHFALKGSARRDSASSAAILRIERSAVGMAEKRTTRPSTNATSACSMRARSRSGIANPASAATDSR